MLELKVGDFLICHSVCKMMGGGKTTTIGKSYKIIKIYDDCIYIKDDENDEHAFRLSNYQKWFNDIKRERKSKLNRINSCKN